MKLLCLTFSLLLLAWPAAATDKYFTVAGGGAGGSWSDPATFSVANLGSRGTTNWVADGSYSGFTYNQAQDGSTYGIIKKATVTTHGTSTGWADTMGDDQASFGTITIRTPYLLLDGSERTESATWAAPAGYGFKVSSIYASSNDGDDADFAIIQYCDFGPTYTTTFSSGWGENVYLVYNQTDITFRRCAFHNGLPALFQAAGADNLTIEYCDFGPGWGKEAIRGGNQNLSSGWTIRYNRFWNSSQYDPDDVTSGITAEIGIWAWGDGETATGFKIYGNWFYNEYSAGRNAVIVVGGDGVSWLGGPANGTLVYNNTFGGISDSPGFGAVSLNGTGTEAKNNLFYQTWERTWTASAGTDILTIDNSNGDDDHPYQTGDATYVGGLTGGSATGLYYVNNISATQIYLYDTSGNASAGGTTGRFDVTAADSCYTTRAGNDWVNASTEANNLSIVTNAFSNYASRNYQLAGATGPGTSLSSPYDTDPDGNTRGSDGTFDIGAYEFVSGADETAPTFTSATIGTSGTTITLAFNESVTFGAGGNGGWALSMSGGAVTLSYSSGSGTSSLVYSLSRTVYSGETVSTGLTYTQPANGIEDTAGNDFAGTTDHAVTNNST